MSTNSRAGLAMTVVILAASIAGCTNDPSASAEYEVLEQELAAVVAERDALAAAAAAAQERHDKSVATQDAIVAILDDPQSFGSEDEVIELLASYATADAQFGDAVLGSIDMKTGWYNTLYDRTMDARIDTYHRWVSDDGSQGGALWVWYGTNLAGNAFELVGLSLNDYDEDGMLAYQWVVYPYSDEYVLEAVTGNGT